MLSIDEPWLPNELFSINNNIGLNDLEPDSIQQIEIVWPEQNFAEYFDDARDIKVH